MDFKAALSQLRKLFVLLDYDGQGTLDFNEARPFLQFLVRKYISSTLSTDEQHLELMRANRARRVPRCRPRVRAY